MSINLAEGTDMTLTEPTVDDILAEQVLLVVDDFLRHLDERSIGDYVKTDLVRDLCLDVRLAASKHN